MLYRKRGWTDADHRVLIPHGWGRAAGMRGAGPSRSAMRVWAAVAGGCGLLWVALAGGSGPAVPVVVVGAYAEYLRQRPQRREDEVLHPDGCCGDPAFVAEVPEGGAELERVLRGARGCGLAGGG